MFCRQIAAHLSGFLLAVPANEAVHHRDERQAGVIRKGVMMRDARLGERPGLRLCGVTEGRQRQRQNAHGGSIPGVAIRERAFDGAVHDIAPDAAAAGIANVGRSGFQPGRKFFAHIPCIEGPAPNDRAAERQRHLSIVGHFPRFEPQPAAAHDLAVNAVLSGNLPFRHELDRGTERVADGKAQKRSHGPVFDSQTGHAMASLNILDRHAVIAADHQILAFALQRVRR